MKETALCPIDTVNVSISPATAGGRLPGKLVRVISTADCFIKFGDSTVAAAVTDCPLIGGTPEYFSMEASGLTYISAITSAAATGVLSVTSCM